MRIPLSVGVATFLVLFGLLQVSADSSTSSSSSPNSPSPSANARRSHHHHSQHLHHHSHNRQHPSRLRHHQLSSRQQQRLVSKGEAPSLPLRDPKEEVELLDDVGSRRRNASTSTRLRRIGARDYYNKVVQRRLNAQRSNKNSNSNSNSNDNNNNNNEWAYNTYNLQTNTFGSTMAGKGDDNTDDVEFISTGDTSNEWPRRGVFGGFIPSLMPASTSGPPTRRTTTTTLAPPALVPARRGYATAAPPLHTTEDPFEMNTISRGPSNSEPKDMERRHICVQQRTITMPVKTTEVYTRPIWKHISTPCQPQTHANQMCTRVQLVHEQAFRDVIRHKSAQQVTYECCAGWMRESPHADACLKPVCSTRCQNGGSCSGPETCSCPPGYGGQHCEQDINECKEEKPCDQTCINTVGSYFCKCRDGFALQPDQQSCRKTDAHEDDAFEARDLENEIETQEDVSARLHKIERTLENERVATNELQKTLQATYNMVDTLKSRLTTLEKQQQDISRLQSNLYATESRTNKLEGMVNLLMKCRNGPNAYCP